MSQKVSPPREELELQAPVTTATDSIDMYPTKDEAVLATSTVTDEEGAISESRHTAAEGRHGGLPMWDRIQMLVHRMIPPGGHLSNIFNISSTTLGIGIVSMAGGFNQTGVVLSVMLMIICGVMISFSYYLLGCACEATPYRTWETLGRGILGRGWDHFVNAAMIVLNLGVTTSYVIVVGDLIPPFLTQLPEDHFCRTRSGTRLLTATVWLFCMYALTLMRNAASLRYFSFFGVVLVLYFVFAVVIRSSLNGMPHLHDMKLFASGLDAVNGITLFIFSFMGHSLVIRLYDEMPNPSAKHLAIDGGCSVLIVGIFYFLVGFFGYADIGPTIEDSLFKYYSIHKDVMMMLAYIGMLLKVCVGYALVTQACRISVLFSLHLPHIDVIPYWQLWLVNTVICLVSLMLGLFIPDVSIVFNLLGSLCGGVLAFLLPVYLVFYIGGWTLTKVGWWRWGMSYLNLVTGVFAVVFGTGVTIQGVAQQYS